MSSPRRIATVFGATGQQGKPLSLSSSFLPSHVFTTHDKVSGRPPHALFPRHDCPTTPRSGAATFASSRPSPSRLVLWIMLRETMESMPVSPTFLRIRVIAFSALRHRSGIRAGELTSVAGLIAFLSFLWAIFYTLDMYWLFDGMKAPERAWSS